MNQEQKIVELPSGKRTVHFEGQEVETDHDFFPAFKPLIKASRDREEEIIKVIKRKHSSLITSFLVMNEITKQSNISHFYTLLALMYAEGEYSGAKKINKICDRKEM